MVIITDFALYHVMTDLGVSHPQRYLPNDIVLHLLRHPSTGGLHRNGLVALLGRTMPVTRRYVSECITFDGDPTLLTPKPEIRADVAYHWPSLPHFPPTRSFPFRTSRGRSL